MAFRYGALASYVGPASKFPIQRGLGRFRGDAVTPWLQCAQCARHILRMIRRVRR